MNEKEARETLKRYTRLGYLERRPFEHTFDFSSGIYPKTFKEAVQALGGWIDDEQQYFPRYKDPNGRWVRMGMRKYWRVTAVITDQEFLDYNFKREGVL